MSRQPPVPATLVVRWRLDATVSADAEPRGQTVFDGAAPIGLESGACMTVADVLRWLPAGADPGDAAVLPAALAPHSSGASEEMTSSSLKARTAALRSS